MIETKFSIGNYARSSTTSSSARLTMGLTRLKPYSAEIYSDHVPSTLIDELHMLDLCVFSVGLHFVLECQKH